MTLALDLTAFDREDAEAADWSDEREDFAEDLAADSLSRGRHQLADKKKQVLLTFKCLSQISMDWFLASASAESYAPMRSVS